jgi:two-component system, OmpR family, alkaline phosphatase synthesis response regulator PhoP
MVRVLLVGTESENLRLLNEALTVGGLAAVVLHPTEAAVDRSDDNPDAVIFDLTSGLTADVVGLFLKESELSGKIASLAAIARERSADLQPDIDLDDFFIWPGWPEEVHTRVRRAIWRRNGSDPSQMIHAGDLTIDTANYRVYLAGRAIDLRYKEYELLRYLAINPDRVLTREALLNGVWGYNYFGGVRTVDVHIRRLRSRIEDRTHTFIETVRNVGYRFHVGI